MTAAYLSSAWFEQARTAIAGARISRDPDQSVRFGYTITEVPDELSNDGTVRYGIALDPTTGTATIESGSGEGDVRFTMTYAVAFSVASGKQNGSKAFLNGDVQLGGNVDLLIERAQDLASLDGLLPAAPGLSA